MTINIAKDYSPFVLGRFESDSKYNGEDFRDTHLLPALYKLIQDKSKTLIINLNGTFSPDTSFLEEVFGGAVRCLKKEDIDSKELWKNQITIKYDDEASKKEILGYIQDELKR